MIIKRNLLPYLLADAQKSPVVAILGPRQSGKTTLARVAFNKHRYVSLEDLDSRTFATTDPRGFLQDYKNEYGIILDEVQHVPSLLSYIQTDVDLNYKPGYYILTGSQNFLLNQSITQTLAGRIALHTLLPLSISEIKHENLLPDGPEKAMHNGFYPLMYSRKDNPNKWYRDYIRTYVERDVRTLAHISDLDAFQRFMKLCAGHIGQEINFSALGSDAGISYNTAKSWLSILQASYIVFFLQPHFKNFNKRIVKSPKLFFYDTGLACSLLGIETEDQLLSHYLRGGIFESMIIADLFKNSFNADRLPHLYFWCDKTKHEVDCIIERGTKLYPIEIKSGKTISPDYFDGLSYWNELSGGSPDNSFVVYGGNDDQKRSRGNVLSWQNVSKIDDHVNT
ncbi:MAG: ATP-binding protein [Candidatus Babeliales bacterium]|nr:ATP-binding protein [Candidatus Babeliales bacterium]